VVQVMAMRKTLKSKRAANRSGTRALIIAMSWLNGVAWLIPNYGIFTYIAELQ